METQDPRPWLERIELIGGLPCLDFINSVSDHAGPTPTERLLSYADLMSWSERCALIGGSERARFTALAHEDPRAAAAALKAVLRFREAAFRMFVAVAGEGLPADEDLAEVNRAVKKAQAELELVPVAGHFHLAWRETGAGPEQILWRLARAVVDLMTSDDLLTLRVCAGDACGWLFLDKSRNHLRRWCSMSDCGNRAKAREFYKRLRSA
ncbi:MAG: CGNR zinc finger domain-containing protein [Gammaproteobacteria bacterium]